MHVTRGVQRCAPDIAWQGPIVVVIAVGLGYLVARSPQAAIALALAPTAILAIRSGTLRMLIVTYGALMVFNSSSGVTYAKGLYIAILIVCGVAAWHASSASASPESARIRRAAGIACLAILATMTASFPVAMSHGHEPTLWVRDIFPYLLLAVIPILGWDAAQHVSHRLLVSTFVIVGVLSTASLMLQYIALRGLATLPIDKLFFGGLLLPVALFAYACARAIGGRRRGVLLWAVLAGAILTAILISGARSGILLLAAPIAIVAFQKGIGGIGRAAVLGLIGTALLLGAFRFGGSAGLDIQQIQDRISTTNSAISAPSADGSLSARFQLNRTSWRLVRSAPITGVGAGYLFEYQSGSGARIRTSRAVIVDSSISTLAKFGLMGIVALFVFLRMILRMVRQAGSGPAKSGLIGLAAFCAPFLVIGNPVENKGLALGLLFLLGLTLTAGRQAPGLGRSAAPSAHRTPA